MRRSHSSTGSLLDLMDMSETRRMRAGGGGEFARHGPVCTVAAVTTRGGVVAQEAPRVSSTPH